MLSRLASHQPRFVPRRRHADTGGAHKGETRHGLSSWLFGWPWPTWGGQRAAGSEQQPGNKRLTLDAADGVLWLRLRASIGAPSSRSRDSPEGRARQVGM